MSRNNCRIFLASVISFVFFFSFFQTSQAGFFDWFKKFRKNDSQSAIEVVSSVQQDAFYTASISKSGSGVVTSDDGKINCGKQCKASFPANSKIVLKAEAGNDYKFDRWNGCDKVSGGECQTTLNKSKIIVVKFAFKKAGSSLFLQKSSSSSASKTSSSKASNSSSRAASSKSSSVSNSNSSVSLSSLSSSPNSALLVQKHNFSAYQTSSSSAPSPSTFTSSSSLSSSKSSSSSSAENFITSSRTSIPWTIEVLVLDDIDQNSKVIEPLKEAIVFVESFSKFDITYSLIFSSLPHTYTKYDCGEGLQTCVIVNYWDIDGAIMDSLPVADSYIIFWNTNNQPPLQAGSTWGVDSWGILKGGIKRPYATIPVDMWWYNNNPFEGFQRRSAQIISHELINIINAKLEAAPYYCASLSSTWADRAYINESERLKKLTDDCYNKY